MPKVEIHLPEHFEGMVVDGVIEKTAGSSLLTEQVVGGKLLASFNTEKGIANYLVFRLKSTWN